MRVAKAIERTIEVQRKVDEAFGEGMRTSRKWIAIKLKKFILSTPLCNFMQVAPYVS